MRKLLLILLVLPFIISCKDKKVATTTTSTTVEDTDPFRCVALYASSQSYYMMEANDKNQFFYEKILKLIYNNGKNLSSDAEQIIYRLIAERLSATRADRVRSYRKAEFAEEECKREKEDNKRRREQ